MKDYKNQGLGGDKFKKQLRQPLDKLTEESRENLSIFNSMENKGYKKMCYRKAKVDVSSFMDECIDAQ